MANVYTQEFVSNQPSASPTEQTRLHYCDVSTQLTVGNIITIVTTNSAAVCCDMFAFNNVASGAAASHSEGHNAGATSIVSGSLTAATAGDIVLAGGCIGNSPTMSSFLDNSAGNTMTQLGSTQAGQSRTSWSVYRVESATTTFQPRCTASTSQAYAYVDARWNNNGSTISLIASSWATSGWQADPGNKTFTITVPVTIPVGSKLFIHIPANANTAGNAISDNAGASGSLAANNRMARNILLRR